MCFYIRISFALFYLCLFISQNKNKNKKKYFFIDMGRLGCAKHMEVVWNVFLCMGFPLLLKYDPCNNFGRSYSIRFSCLLSNKIGPN